MNFRLKKFSELSNHELYDLLKLRSEVFVVEQKCAYQDLDDKDQKSLHLLAYSGSRLSGYARLLPAGLSYKEAAIGRVVISPADRNNRFGYLLMEQAIRNTLIAFNTFEVVISAQKYLENFYTKLGFVTESDTYLEDDIPHIKMRYRHTASAV